MDQPIRTDVSALGERIPTAAENMATGRVASYKHPAIAPPLTLTAKEQEEARWRGIDYATAEQQKAEALAKNHGMSVGLVRAATHAGQDLQLASDLARASTLDEMQAAHRAHARRQQAAEQVLLEQAVAAARKGVA